MKKKNNAKTNTVNVTQKKLTSKTNNAIGSTINTIKEFDFKIVAAIGFILSLVLLIFSYKYFGSYFEMNDDPRYVMAMKGFASPLPYDNFVSVYKLTVSLYINLYKHFPDIAWYGLSMFLLLLGALFNIYLAMYFLIKNRIHFLLFILLFIAFYFLVFFQNVFWINFTRPSLLVTSSFIILLSVLYINNEYLKKHKWLLVFPATTYILGHFTRLDAGYLGFVFGLAFSIILVFKKQRIIPFLLKYIAPVVVFILFTKVADTISQKNNVRNKDFLEKTEIIRQLIDYRNAAAYVPKTIQDTIAYNAMLYARYCSDDKIISVDFLKKLTNESPLLEKGNGLKAEEELTTFYKSLKAENSVSKSINYTFYILAIIWLLLAYKSNYIGFIKILLFQLFFFALIAGMSYYMKLPARIYNPLLVLLTFSNLLFLFSELKFEKKQFNYLFILPCLFVLFNVSEYASANNKLISEYKKYGQVNHMMVDDMNRTFTNTIFIPTNLRSWEMHNATDPIKEINLKNKNCYVYLSIELSLAPETKDQLIDKFGTDDHSLLFKKISEMDNVIFISDDNYNNFLRGYYHYLYNQDYYFEKVNETPTSFYQYTGLNFYRLKKYK